MKISIAFLFVLVSITYAKSQIKGKIVSQNGNGIANATVVLEDDKSKEVITYQLTDENGIFSFDIDLQKGVYTLRVNHLAYHPIEKSIVRLSAPEDDSTVININLTLQKKDNVIDEVVVEVSPPIIVKKDTTIYNINQWTRQTDETLEQVLRKINGFQILPNGELIVDGEKINKVLVDGKEITNLGAAILTKSINPNDVENVEVRFDEQNNAIKESLLNNDKFAVLDIKLKKELKRSLFGKLKQTSGYRSQLNIGGYANLFSLKGKTNSHLFVESDDFGKKTISLRDIRNLGSEAVAKMFDLPADFNEFKERDAFEEELFGVENFTLSKNKIIGFSINKTINESTNVFFGSYNANNELERQSLLTQSTNSSTRKIASQLDNQLLSSKNKLQISYNKDSTKIRADINYILDNDTDATQIENELSAVKYDFNKERKGKEFYSNLIAEHQFNNKVGVQFKGSFSDSRPNHRIDYLHNDDFLALLLQDELNTSTYSFLQDINRRHNQLFLKGMLQYDWGKSKLQVASQFNEKELYSDSFSQNTVSTHLVNSFNQLGQTINANTFITHLDFLWSSKEMSTFNSIGVSRHKFRNNLLFEDEAKTGIYLKSNINIDINRNFTVGLSYKDQLQSMPLSKQNNLNELQNFQTILVPPNSLIQPKRESVFEFSSFYNDLIENSSISLSFLRGKSYSQNSTSLNESSFFITNTRNQLESNYLLGSLQITKDFYKYPFQIKLEPEMANNSIFNLDSEGNIYETRVNRYLLGFKFSNLSSNQRLGYSLYSKFTSIEMQQTSNGANEQFMMFSNQLLANYDLIKETVFLTGSVRNVNFANLDFDNYLNSNIKLTYNPRLFNYELILSNVLNNTNFVRQDVTPVYFKETRNRLFDRYIKLGISYKFN